HQQSRSSQAYADRELLTQSSGIGAVQEIFGRSFGRKRRRARKNPRRPMSTIVRTGATIARTDISNAPPSSAVAKTGLAKPPVVIVDAPRNKTVEPWTTLATPPPAMIASVHRKKGLTSVTKEAVMIDPATIAAGVASESRRWSTHGI